MLTFEPIPHIYRWNGEIVPSVTQVLEDVGIIDYSNIPWNVREMALERGRMVHEMTQFFDEGDLDEETVDEMLAGYLQAWIRWKTDAEFECELIEHRGYHAQYGYAGTLDRKGTIKRGGTRVKVVVDLKSNDAPKWAALQTGSYTAFFEDPRTYTRVVVELHRDGTYRVDIYEGKEWQNDFNRFLMALSVYRMKREYNVASYKQRMRAAQKESV